ncbi:MAG: hypothetical protein IKI68_02990 [Clostridia bacterium]|nr:hypothetical protein [Clostridia bacterium]
MRYFRWIIAFLAVAITIVRVVLYISKSDIDVGPTITCEKEIFEIKCGDDEAELLKYVSASDPQDGEIKDITIEKQYFLNDNKSRITFVAIDSDNNIAKISKEIIYTDYVGPRIKALTSAVFFANDDAKNNFQYEAYDQFSGDITERVKLIVSKFNRRVSGVYPATLKVSNYYGTSRTVDFNIYVFPSVFPQTIELNEYITYCSKGQQKPDFASFIKNSSVGVDKITIDDSELDLDTDGSYEVKYYVGDKNDPTAFNRLVVVVGD